MMTLLALATFHSLGDLRQSFRKAPGCRVLLRI
jgi:hypothetical protein